MNGTVIRYRTSRIPAFTAFLLGQYIFTAIFFSHIWHLCSSIGIRDSVLQPYKTADRWATQVSVFPHSRSTLCHFYLFWRQLNQISLSAIFFLSVMQSVACVVWHHLPPHATSFLYLFLVTSIATSCGNYSQQFVLLRFTCCEDCQQSSFAIGSKLYPENVIFNTLHS